MTDATAAITPSTIALGVFAENTARNITNLANHPASGGIPASDKRNMLIATASSGSVCPRPEYESISAERVRRATAITTANAPRVIAP